MSSDSDSPGLKIKNLGLAAQVFKRSVFRLPNDFVDRIITINDRTKNRDQRPRSSHSQQRTNPGDDPTVIQRNYANNARHHNRNQHVNHVDNVSGTFTAFKLILDFIKSVVFSFNTNHFPKDLGHLIFSLLIAVYI